MAKQYPLVKSVIKASKNTSAKCKCGNVAKFKAEICYNYFRGDDDLIWSCDDHKRSLIFLISRGSNGLA